MKAHFLVSSVHHMFSEPVLHNIEKIVFFALVSVFRKLNSCSELFSEETLISKGYSGSGADILSNKVCNAYGKQLNEMSKDIKLSVKICTRTLTVKNFHNPKEGPFIN